MNYPVASQGYQADSLDIGADTKLGKLPGEVKKEHTWRTRADFLDRMNKIYMIFIDPVDPVKKWNFLYYQDMVRQIPHTRARRSRR